MCPGHGGWNEPTGWGRSVADLSGRVLVTGDSIEQCYLDQLAEAGLEVSNPVESFPPAILSDETLRDRLHSCVGYILGGDEIASASVLEAVADELRVVAFLGVGYESFIDAAAARRLGIRVTNTPGVLSNAVAEFTVGMLLDARRRINEYATSVRQGIELRQEKRSDLAGHPVGVVGLGAIGTRVCEILGQGLRADVRYFSRTRKPEEEDRLDITYAPLAELVAEVECLIVMVPETPETSGMITRDLFAQRIADGTLIVINTSRADVIEPDGLLWALETGRVESARFDGFYRQSSEASLALARRSDVTITPHIASLTHEARHAMAAMAVGSLLSTLRTGHDTHVVNGFADA